MSRASKSRFKSAIGKKIEKQVRKDAAFFRLYANNRRGCDVASGANHSGKHIMNSNIRHKRKANRNGKHVMDSNIRHKRNVSSNEKLASAATNTSKTNKTNNVANDTNRRDNVSSLFVGQTPIKDSNSRHFNSSTMNVSLDPSLRSARENNRRDDGSLATLSRIDHKSSVLVEANRQVNHASRPIKQDPPRKNTNTKRVEAIMPNVKITRRDDSIVVLRSLEDHDPLKAKTTMNRSNNINNSQSPQFKAMAGLVQRTKNFDGSDGYNEALPSRLKRQVSLDNLRDKQYMIEATEEASASPKQMKQRSKEANGEDTSDRDPMGETNGDAYPLGVKHYYSEKSLTYGSMKRQRGNAKENEDESMDNGDMELMEVEDGSTQLETRDCGPKNKKKRGIESNEVGDGTADDSFAKKKLESLPKDHVSLDCSDEATQPEKLTHRKLKKWRQGIMRNEDEELHIDGGDHSPSDVDGDSLRLTSHAPISIDCLTEVPSPFVLEHVKQQCNYCSKPIDEPIWSGIFKIDGEEDISLAGYLSTKSCDIVWKLSRSLMPVVEVTKLSRSKFKIWETSKPSCDSIGLYFFPNKMRHDEDLDKLVNEVIKDDLALQTVIGEAEMLIFPSTLLPERYKTFQRKHYLWGVFRPRQDQCATVTEPVHDTECRAQENEKEEQHASNQQDEVQQVHWKSPAKSMQQAAATGGVPVSPNMDFRPEASEERQLGDALRCNLHSAEDNAVAINPAAVTTEATAFATNAATRPAEATENDTNAATIPGNLGRSNSVAGVPPDRFFCFIAGQTPKLEQLIQEIQREGSLVVAIRGEAIGGGQWPGNIESSNISRA